MMPPTSNYVPAVAPQERRPMEGWREPAQTSAAINENIVGGIGAGMVVAAICVLVLPAWYFWPLPAWLWGILLMVSVSLAVGGLFNLVRFWLDEWRGLRWVSAAKATMLEQEEELAKWKSAAASKDNRITELQRDNAALKQLLEAKHPSMRYADTIDSTATYVAGPKQPQPVASGQRRDPAVMAAVRLLLVRAQAERPDVSRGVCVPAFMTRAEYDEAMRILSIVGAARKTGAGDNAPWTVDPVADLDEMTAAAERYVSPVVG